MYGRRVTYLEIQSSSQEIMGAHYQQVFYGHKQLLYFQSSFCYNFQPLSVIFANIYCNPKSFDT